MELNQSYENKFSIHLVYKASNQKNERKNKENIKINFLFIRGVRWTPYVLFCTIVILFTSSISIIFSPLRRLQKTVQEISERHEIRHSKQQNITKVR